jgi:hypothetical protein
MMVVSVAVALSFSGKCRRRHRQSHRHDHETAKRSNHKQSSKGERLPKPALSISFFDDYILLLVQVFVESSHFMWAFSQPALVVGTLEAARPGPAKATANPTATMTERNFFIWISSPR